MGLNFGNSFLRTNELREGGTLFSNLKNDFLNHAELTKTGNHTAVSSYINIYDESDTSYTQFNSAAANQTTNLVWNFEEVKHFATIYLTIGHKKNGAGAGSNAFYLEYSKNNTDWTELQSDLNGTETEEKFYTINSDIDAKQIRIRMVSAANENGSVYIYQLRAVIW